jgi:hypothetical protein
MKMNDIGRSARRGEVPRGDFLRSNRAQREDPGYARMLPSAVPPAAAFIGDHVHIVAQRGRTFGQVLDDPFHPPGMRPIVFREVEDAHTGNLSGAGQKSTVGKWASG